MRMNEQRLRGMMKDTVYNAVVGASARIQARRAKKGKRQMVKRNFSQVRRKQGGLFRQPASVGSLTKTTVKTVASNVGTGIRNLQSPAVRVESGTEYMDSIASLNSEEFQVLASVQVNPCDPGVFAGLSTISNQYQKFRCIGMKFVFVPQSPSTVAGKIYLAFTPDAQASPPSDEVTFAGLEGCVSGALYGEPTVLRLTPKEIQQAFNIQTASKPDTENGGTAINTVGTLFMALAGVQASSSGVVLGTLYVSYQFAFYGKKVTTGPDGLACAVRGLSEPGDTTLTLTSYAGHFPFKEVLDGVWRPRAKHAQHLMAMHCTGMLHGGDNLQVSADRGATWNFPAYQYHSYNAVTGVLDKFAVIPARNYIRFAVDEADTVAAEMYITTLPAHGSAWTDL